MSSIGIAKARCDLTRTGHVHIHAASRYQLNDTRALSDTQMMPPIKTAYLKLQI